MSRPELFNINSMLFLSAVNLGGQDKTRRHLRCVRHRLPNRLLGVEFLGINLGDLKYLFLVWRWW